MTRRHRSHGACDRTVTVPLRLRARGPRWPAVLSLVASALGGCAQPQVQPRSAPPPVNLSGYSAVFKEGFKDGCDTARGTARRDDKRYGAQSQYAQGWQDGKAICAKR